VGGIQEIAHLTMDYKGVIFDINGVLEFQGVVYPGAVELFDLLRSKGIVIRILTNSTLKSRKDCAEKLNRMGFDVAEDEVVTASFATAQYLRMLKPRSCWVMLKGKGLDEFRDFCHDDRNPEYIVLGDYRDGFNFQNMNKALKLLIEGSQLIVMIPEKVDHSMGEVELTVGAYGRMLEDAARINGVTIGKPNAGIYDISLLTMGIPKNSVLMVGDRVDTDIAGAKAAGIRSVLVKTGEFRARDLEGELQPDFVIESVRDLAEFFP
jgi:HAD superfamily hydrolase (TIGR01458 family)